MLKQFWWAGLFFWFSLVLCPSLGHTATVLDFALCKGVDQDGLPLERLEQFSSEDEVVVCWVFLDQVRAGDELRWEFTGPEGIAFESRLRVERDQRYVGAKGELHLVRFSSRIQPGFWSVSFFFNDQKNLELGFKVVGSDILTSPDIEEGLLRTRDLLKEFGYLVQEINVTEGNQSFIRMNAASDQLNQSFWNQLGRGFEALNRLVPDLDWFMVQLVWQEQYILSFQVRAIDFDLWRSGALTKDEFWKNKVIRYVYDLHMMRDVFDVRQFYVEHFGVVF